MTSSTILDYTICVCVCVCVCVCAEWKDIHVGIMGKDFNIKCCNTIIFILKYIIFRSRSEGAIPTPEEIYKKIMGYRDDEKEIASKRNKLGLHLLIWENVIFETRA